MSAFSCSLVDFFVIPYNLLMVQSTRCSNHHVLLKASFWVLGMEGIHQPWNRSIRWSDFFPTKNDSFLPVSSTKWLNIEKNRMDLRCFWRCMYKSETSQQMFNASITLHHIPCWNPKISKSMRSMPYKKNKVQGFLELLTNLWCLWSQGNPWTACRASSCCSSRARAWSRSRDSLRLDGSFSRIIIIESKVVGDLGIFVEA